MTLTTTRSDPWTPIFSCGEHGGRTWSREDLKRMVLNHSLLRTEDGGGVIPPVRVGHADPNLSDIEAINDPLAAGHISALRLDERGGRLLARQSQVPADVRDLIRPAGSTG